MDLNTFPGHDCWTQNVHLPNLVCFINDFLIFFPEFRALRALRAKNERYTHGLYNLSNLNFSLVLVARPGYVMYSYVDSSVYDIDEYKSCITRTLDVKQWSNFE